MTNHQMLSGLFVVLQLLNACTQSEEHSPEQQAMLADPAPNQPSKRVPPLSADLAAPPPPGGASPAPIDQGGACAGSGGLLSIMVVGIDNCAVTVGGVSFGIAPAFKKPSPVGNCTVDVKCPGRAVFKTSRNLRAGGDERIVVRPEDWR